MTKLAAILIMVPISLGCSKPQSTTAEAKQAGPVSVYVVNYPLEFFARRLVPESVAVHFPAPANVDPAFWNPSAEVVVQYQNASLIVLNGAQYAKWTGYATLPEERLVTSSNGCGKLLKSTSSVDHQHGPEGEHQHGDWAFTTWLDLRLASCQARTVRDALIKLLPDDKADLEASYKALEKELTSAHDALIELGRFANHAPLLGSHPVYQYLAEAYDLNIESVHFEPDAEPDEAAFNALERLLQTHPGNYVLWEDEPLDSTKQRLGNMGVESVVFDPLSRRPAQGDFLALMRDNVERLACALGERSCP